MNLKEALVELHLGKNMCRSSWTVESGYLALMCGMDYVWKIVLKPNPNAGNYIFTLEDLEAEDWQEFVLAKEAEVELM